MGLCEEEAKEIRCSNTAGIFLGENQASPCLSFKGGSVDLVNIMPLILSVVFKLEISVEPSVSGLGFASWCGDAQ